jgi:hypothetical protein
MLSGALMCPLTLMCNSAVKEDLCGSPNRRYVQLNGHDSSVHIQAHTRGKELGCQPH